MPTNDARAGDGWQFPDLRRFFAPRSVAFIGATEDQTKFGGRSLRLLLDFGYDGRLYPINPRRDQVFGVRCLPSLAALPEVPDHVAIMLPADRAAEAVEECGRLGVPFATVFSSGYAELGTDEGRRRQVELVAAARRSGIRIMGPNCNGIANFVDRFALTSTGTLQGPRRAAGRIGVASQSGGLGQTNVMWRAQQAGLGISYTASTGNDADLDLLDYVAFMLDDSHTDVVLALAERITDGRKLRAVAERAADRGKPIVMLKIGRTPEGSRAAASHTGSVTGPDEVCDAALRQYGILRVDDCRDLYEVGMLLRRGRLPGGSGASATCISGGNVVLVADLGASLGIRFPSYEETTRQRLREIVPDFGSIANPTDLTAASVGHDDAYARVCEILLADPGVDLMIPIFTIASSREVRLVAEVAERSTKPMAILWTGRSDDPAFTAETLVAQGHAVYRDTLPCLRAVAAAMGYAEFLRERAAGDVPVRPADVRADEARDLVAATGRRAMTEHESKRLLALYGLPVTREELAVTAEAAVRAAARLGGRVAIKAQSPELPHKTEAKAIRLGVEGAAAVAAAFDEVLAAARSHRPDATIHGVLVQEMVDAGQEWMLGMSRDPVFGPVLAVGLGGIMVELLRDVAFCLPPVTHRQARRLLERLRAYPMLTGFRGDAPADVDALVDCIVRLSWLAADLGDAIAELDVNPLKLASVGGGARVVDALVIVQPTAVPTP